MAHLTGTTSSSVPQGSLREKVGQHVLRQQLQIVACAKVRRAEPVQLGTSTDAFAKTLASMREPSTANPRCATSWHPTKQDFTDDDEIPHVHRCPHHGENEPVRVHFCLRTSASCDGNTASSVVFTSISALPC